MDFDNNLCLVLVPYLSFTFPTHGQHIREYTDTPSPEAAARIRDDAAASRCLWSTSCILYYWDFYRYQSNTRKYAVQTPRSAPITQRLKTKTGKKGEKKRNPLHSISILPEPPSFEPLLTNATAVMEVEKRSASSHGDLHIISHMSIDAS